VLLLATAETSHRILADDSRAVIGELGALDVSFDPLGLVGRGRFYAGGKLRQITSFGAEQWESGSSVGLFRLHAKSLAGPQTPTEVLQSTALVHVVGTF
jgi:hypothetical protein